MGEKLTAPRPRRSRPGSSLGTSSVGNLDQSDERLLARLARRLDVADLEAEILIVLRERLPGSTALVSLDPDSPEPSRRMDNSGIRRWRQREAIPRLVAVPLSDGGDSLGFIAVVDDSGIEAWREQATGHLLDVAAAAAIPARNARTYSAALELTLRDPLTGLFNRRAFEAFLEREEQRALRNNKPLSVVLVDLDRLKQINDAFGHEAGDTALKTLAANLEQAVRRSDIVTRPGGDEFAIVLPETSAAGATRIAQRLRKLLAAHPVALSNSSEAIVLTVSCGLADLEQGAGDAERMLRLADLALYEAKREGRDRVAVSSAQ